MSLSQQEIDRLFYQHADEEVWPDEDDFVSAMTKASFTAAIQKAAAEIRRQTLADISDECKRRKQHYYGNAEVTGDRLQEAAGAAMENFDNYLRDQLRAIAQSEQEKS